MKKYLKLAFVLLILIVIFGTIYTVVQQSQRLEANDPQIQLALETADKLNTETANKIDLGAKINLNKSLAPFLIIYDSSGKALKGNGFLNGRITVVPFGVLKNSEGKDYNFVSWQPQNNLRFALVSVKARDGYVLSGRSLKEVEKREQVTLELSLLGLFMSFVLVGAYYLLLEIINRKLET